MAENMVIDGEANSLSAAKTVIKRAWRKYSPGCAHASAFFMRKRSGREPVALYESGKISLAEFDFLELSEIASGEHLRKLGEQMIPKHGNEPILDPERTWRVPD